MNQNTTTSLMDDKQTAAIFQLHSRSFGAASAQCPGEKVPGWTKKSARMCQAEIDDLGICNISVMLRLC